MYGLGVVVFLAFSYLGSCSDECLFPSEYPPQYIAYKAPTPPKIDGNLDEPFWEDVAFTDKFLDIQGPPPKFEKPRFTTKAKIRWDDEWLYIGGYAEEPQVWANLTKHDTVIFHDNDFEVFINPDGTSHYYKEYEMNALNTDWSLCLNKPYLNHGYENSSRVFGKHGWDDLGLKKAVRVVGGSVNSPHSGNVAWTVEIAFPLKAINLNETTSVPPKQGQYWRINFSRVEYYAAPCPASWNCSLANYYKVNNTQDNWVWAPTGVIDIHLPEYWGYVQFSEEAVNTTKRVNDPDWTIRYIAMQLYYAEKKYFKAQPHHQQQYTESVAELLPYVPNQFALSGICSELPEITVVNHGQGFIARVPTRFGNARYALIRDDRFLKVYSEGDPAPAEVLEGW